MLKRKFWGLLAIFIGLALPLVADAQSGRSAIMAQANGWRSNNGLATWRWNDALAVAAQEQANWMAANNLYVHNHDGSTPVTRARSAGYTGYVAEIIVGGWDVSPAWGMNWWLNSAPHYNILSSNRYVEAGSGFATNGRSSYYVIVTGFGSSASPPRAAPVVEAEPQTEPIRVVPIALATPDEDGNVIHTVEQGQTAWAIAAVYDVPLAELLYLNQLPQTPLLAQGQRLLVKLGPDQTPPPTPTPNLTYTVREGQTLWTVAALHSISLDDLLWLNGLQANTFIQPGDELQVAFKAGESRPPIPTATPQLQHTIQDGETLLEIAWRYGLSLDELLALNGISAETLLKPATTLWIAPPPPAPTATPTDQPTATASPTPVEAVPVAQALGVPDPTATSTPPATSTPRPTATPLTVANGAQPQISPEAAPADVAAQSAPATGSGNTLILAMSALFVTLAAGFMLRR